jgi:hypothetical protein
VALAAPLRLTVALAPLAPNEPDRVKVGEEVFSEPPAVAQPAITIMSEYNDEVRTAVLIRSQVLPKQGFSRSI